MTVSLTTRYALTAAPRSTVVHVVNAGATRNYSNETICGREIREDWAGEYNECPTGPVTCKRCKPVADAIDAENAEILASVAKFPVGSHVGILVGQLSVNGPHIDRYGTVVRHVETWNGGVEYVVADSIGKAVYGAWLLTVDETPDNDEETADRQAREEAANADADAFFGDVAELLNVSPWEFIPCEEECNDSRCLDARADARARSMAAHPAGKARTSVMRIAHEDRAHVTKRQGHGITGGYFDPYTGDRVYVCDILPVPNV